MHVILHQCVFDRETENGPLIWMRNSGFACICSCDENVDYVVV